MYIPWCLTENWVPLSGRGASYDTFMKRRFPLAVCEGRRERVTHSVRNLVLGTTNNLTRHQYSSFLMFFYLATVVFIATPFFARERFARGREREREREREGSLQGQELSHRA